MTPDEYEQQEYRAWWRERNAEAMRTCTHEWIGGMVYVADEDLAEVARMRAEQGSSPIECARCEKVYDPEEET